MSLSDGILVITRLIFDFPLHTLVCDGMETLGQFKVPSSVLLLPINTCT